MSDDITMDDLQRRLTDVAKPVPGPQWFDVTVTTPYGQLVTQRVDANSLHDALLQAAAVPLVKWFPEEEDEHCRRCHRPLPHTDAESRACLAMQLSGQ